MKVIYVAGPYRAPGHHRISKNIVNAMSRALEVWKLYPLCVALCPHGNTAHFDGELPDEAFLEGDLELLKRCDALLTTEDWTLSRGACAEVAYAHSINRPVFHTLEALTAWLHSSTLSR